MVELLGLFTLKDVIIILAILIPWIGKGINGYINLRKEMKKKKSEIVQEALAEKGQKDATIVRFEAGELRIGKLEKDDAEFTQRLNETDKKINLLIASDMLQIKKEIKKIHDKAIRQGWIDSQTLDLLEGQYEIYIQEGGNSWAQKMMEDIRKLPTIWPEKPKE